MRQLWKRVERAFLLGRRSRGISLEPLATLRRPVLVALNAVAVVVAALALTGASGARSSSSPASARTVSGAPALKRADAAGLDIGTSIETVHHDVAPAPDTTSNPDILAPADLIVGESGEIDALVDFTVTFPTKATAKCRSITRLPTAGPPRAPFAATAPTTSPPPGRSTSRRGRRPRPCRCRSSTARTSRGSKLSRSISAQRSTA